VNGRRVDVVGKFFRTLPEVGSQLWTFVNDGGVNALAVIVGTGVLLAVLLGAAKALRDEHGWLSAMFGAMGATIAMYWVFGVIPSAWVYFVDGSMAVLAGNVIPQSLPLMDNFYGVFRDSVVIVLTTVGVMGLAAVTAQIQKRYPGALAEGEEARPQSGGYK